MKVWTTVRVAKFQAAAVRHPAEAVSPHELNLFADDVFLSSFDRS